MAQLKDTIVSGNLRVTDTATANTIQATIIRAPSTSGGTSYSAGTSGQILRSNGTSSYWGSISNSDLTTINNTAAGPLGWTSQSQGVALTTLNTIAYWNGAYSSTNSNLEYCKIGKFGTIVTKASTDYVPNTSAGVSAALNLLSEASANPGLNDYYISQYANGGTTTTTYHRRPILNLWNTFKALITVATTGSGNAITAAEIANDGNNRKITFTKGSTFSLSDHTHNYAGSSSAGGAATSANKLNTNAGSATQPVYFSGGIPVVTTAPASGAFWSTVPPVNSSGVMEIGRYVDFHATTASTNNYDVRLDAANTGTMYLYSNAAGPNFRIRGTLPSLNFVQDTTDAVYNSTKCGIVAYPASTSGVNMVMQSGGNVFVGGGESVTKVYGCIIDAETNPYAAANWTGSEKLFLTADEEMYISTNANGISSDAHTDWTDLNSWVFTSNGYFRPTVNDKSSLGTAACYWHSSYVTNMYANSAELKRNRYPILVLNRDGSANGAFIQFKNSNGVLGYIGMTGAADGGLVRMNSAGTSTPIIHDQDNTTGIGHFCTCSTARDVAAKVATTVSTDTTFKLVTGVSVTVKFTNSNIAEGTSTLNVNGTGAKNISNLGDSNTSRYFWNANAVVDFVYDGTQWIIQHGGTATTTYWGLTKLNSSLTSTSTSYAATASTVKTLNDTKLDKHDQVVLFSGNLGLNNITDPKTFAVSGTTTNVFGVYKELLFRLDGFGAGESVDAANADRRPFDTIIPVDYCESVSSNSYYEVKLWNNCVIGFKKLSASTFGIKLVDDHDYYINTWGATATVLTIIGII